MMTVKDLTASSLTANGLLLRNNEITKNLAPVPSLLSLPSNNSSNHTGSPPTPPNTAKSANSRIHENSEAKKGSRFSFSVDSLLSTVAQTKKPPTPTYSMLFYLLDLSKYLINYNIVSRVHENSEIKKDSRFSFSVDSFPSTVAQSKKTPTPTFDFFTY